jgi:predicted O-methyltransferase YrrM
MNNPTWTEVDRYLEAKLMPPDASLDAALAASTAAGLPHIQVSPSQGKLLYVLAKSIGARSILEVGTLGGYSTIWLARALPKDGQLVTLEYEPTHADVARANLDRAGCAECVEVRVGRAMDTLPQLAAEGRGPFDLIFIDADKAGYPEYFQWAMKLARPGTLIVADNVIRQGAVADASAHDASVQGVQQFFDRVAADPRVNATALQTVGSKGYDGLALVLVER